MKTNDMYTTISLNEIWVLFVIEADERNIGDQKSLEYDLYNDHGIKTLRATFSQIWNAYEIDLKTRVLKVQGREIGIVYYRTGY
jgi:hypothetical protein